jgi:hypothetical protein
VGLFDTLLGRTKQVPPNLDSLFALPTAALTLETQLDMVPSTHGGVCFKAGTGETSTITDTEMREILSVDATDPAVQLTSDDLGFSWFTIHDDDFGSLITRLHGANSTMVDHGLGPRLLCTVVGFVPKAPPGDGDLRLVYLMKRGSFYPFAPRSGEKRDNELELRCRTYLGTDLTIEKDLTHWMALWNLPVA